MKRAHWWWRPTAGFTVCLLASVPICDADQALRAADAAMVTVSRASDPVRATVEAGTVGLPPGAARGYDVAAGADIKVGKRLRTVVRSVETAAIGAEMTGRIIHFPQREGDRFLKGELLVAFDCRKLETELEAAQAAFRALRVAYENQFRLQQYKAAGASAVEQAQYEMEKAGADTRGLEIRATQCAIHAPFDGLVVEKVAQLHEIAQPHQPLVRIVNDRKLELVLMVPSASLASVLDGPRFLFRVDETGHEHEARVIQSTGQIDPVSQTARVIAELVDEAPAIVPGMSGTALFMPGEKSR